MNAAGLRLLCVANGFPLPSETFIAGKVLGLLDRGWDVHVAAASIDPPAAVALLGEHSEPAARLHQVPATPWGGATSLLTGLADGRRRADVAAALRSSTAMHPWRPAPLGEVVARLRPDVIHYEFGPLARRKAHLRAFGARAVVSFRGYDAAYAGLERPGYYDDVWGAVHAVHVLGEDLRRRILARGCPPGTRIEVIPPGIDLGTFSPPLRPAGRTGPLRILGVGRLHWKKGYEHAVAAVRAVRDAGVEVQYRIAGDGEHEPAVRAAIDAFGVGREVTLLGHVAHAQVREELAATDVLLHASVSEGYSNAVVEAQAMAVPVVCSDAEGLAENVADGVTGFVVPRRDPAALATALLRLVADPALADAMGRAGRRRVEERNDAHDQLDRFEALYRSLLA